MIECHKCDRDLSKRKPFIGYRWVYGLNKKGVREWNRYCYICEKRSYQVEHIWEKWK